MKKLVAVGLALLFAGFVMAQGITFWTLETQPERIEKQEQIAADFEALTGISVTIVPVDESDLVTRATAAFGAGDLPDVATIPISVLIGLADEGILDVEAATEVVENLGMDTFAQGALNLAAFDGGVAGVPLSGWTQLLVYRKDLFDEAGLAPPTDFASIEAAVAALHDPPNMFGFVAATDVSQDYMMQVLEEIFLANGMNLLDADGNVDVDNQRTIEVLEFYKKLADASPPGNLYWQQSRELYLAGQAAMVLWSPFIMDELAGLRDSVPVTASSDPTSPELAEKTGFITRLAGPSNPDGAGWASATYLAITVDADIDAAQQFVEYVLSDGYTDWLSFAPEGFFPVRSGSSSGATDFVDAWAQLPVGVDRKAPLAQFYDAEVIDGIVAGLEVASRWGYSQGQGALVGRLYGTRVMSELVREFLDGERDAASTAALLQLEVEALQ